VVDDPDNPGQQIAIHFQEWWIRYRAALPAHRFVIVGIEDATPAPGVLDAIANADVIVLPPSNPIVSIGTILAVPGITDALRETVAPVVGVSPIISGAPVRGMADACLQANGLETSAAAVAKNYGPRSSGGILDGWLVDESDVECVAIIEDAGIACRAVPLLMSDLERTASMARASLDLAAQIG
jgi:LPPG:FO 2-phospho-L-lactate transferase